MHINTPGNRKNILRGTLPAIGLLAGNLVFFLTIWMASKYDKVTIDQFIYAAKSSAAGANRSLANSAMVRVGVLGVAATALIVLPPLLQCIGWNMLLSVCHMAADMFELRALGGVLDVTRRTVRCLIGVLAAAGSFLIIAVTVVSTASTGG